ncbi:Quinolinate phosphoribosyl transferase [Blyttiomyces helicus]|uniref:nicotinate phosphoribosyltransferase n=1 Tax=Blyttiomyces helicus TaxID=388810 RepID=A0A4P9WLQ4_9FUNG|nr:Quinolinate phosphoribosyl transferase [Blyttiomyces helicus]|eukprot:RKO92070.1 Quinolinate phosphoribosyl transferase [Blyttiomyces helicus]
MPPPSCPTSHLPARPRLTSLLDCDLYKFSMQQAVLLRYPNTPVSYTFRNRSSDTHKYTPEAFEVLKDAVDALAELRLTCDEQAWLSQAVPALTPAYLAFLGAFRLNPSQHVTAGLSPTGELAVTISGLWVDTILYEIPLLALISEVYFAVVDRDWNVEGQEERAAEKARALVEGGFGLVPIGTVAYEWVMAVSMYPAAFGTAFTDTYGLNAFLSNFGSDLFNTYPALRDDSDDPKRFADAVTAHYRSLSISPDTKTIVFSDSLDTARSLGASFGIGTFFTNDFRKRSDPLSASKAMNIVIKLEKVDGVDVVKLSDDPGKHQGRPDAVRAALATFGLC